MAASRPHRTGDLHALPKTLLQSGRSGQARVSYCTRGRSGRRRRPLHGVRMEVARQFLSAVSAAGRVRKSHDETQGGESVGAWAPSRGPSRKFNDAARLRVRARLNNGGFAVRQRMSLCCAVLDRCNRSCRHKLVRSKASSPIAQALRTVSLTATLRGK